MKVVLQRVKSVTVTIDGVEKRSIGQGLLVLLGIAETDTLQDAQVLAKKCSELRIFDDQDGKLNLSAVDLQLDCMIISNFTLIADTKKGRRPSFTKSAKQPFSIQAYELFIEESKKYPYKTVQNGEFGTDMQVELINDGPITIVLDTDEWKKG